MLSKFSMCKGLYRFRLVWEHKRCLLPRIVQGTILKNKKNNQQQQEIDIPLLFLLLLVNLPSNVIVSWVLALITMKRFQVIIRQMQEYLTISYLVRRKKMMECFQCQVWKGKSNPVGFTSSKASLPSAYDAIISVGQM